MCVLGEIPAVTQVDEKGHEGSTAVVTAYTSNIEVGENMVKETARQEFLLTTFTVQIFTLNVITSIW